MKFRSKVLSGLILLSGVGLSTSGLAACPGQLTLPTASATNSVTFGDGISYSLPILGISIGSSPGQIDDCIVIGTGSDGQGINTNFAGMDNAFQVPGNNTFFRTGDPAWSPDPTGGPAVGDTPTTWDTTIAALETFLNGSDLAFLFNHNQTNSGTSIDQNVSVWAQIRLWNPLTGAQQFFYVTATDGTFIANFGVSGGDPTAYTGPQSLATCTYPTGSDGGAGCFPTGGLLFGVDAPAGSAAYMVTAQGQVCLNGPVGSGTPQACDGTQVATVNENLGANEFANAVVFPEINAILNSATNPYTNISIDLRMGCNTATSATGCFAGSEMNNGFEQIVIVRLNPTLCVEPDPNCTPGLPEPGMLALLGIGLAAAGLGGLGRRKI